MFEEKFGLRKVKSSFTLSSSLTMEFIAAPPVHRVLCADCGEYLVARRKKLNLITQTPGTPIEPNSANLCIACLRNS